MRKSILFFALFAGMTILAKTTYIPTYMSYLHIVTGIDTLAVTNNLDTLVLADPEGMFVLRIDHEDMTKEKVKAIKRAKRAAGWATFSAVMSGVSTAFSDNSLEYMVRSTNTQITATIADIYSANAKAEQTLGIDMWIDNTTDSELMVCDMERGLVWWILPRQSMQLKLNNPEASRLRISDAQSRVVRYVSALAGSKVTKWEVAWENDNFWIVPVRKEGGYYKPIYIAYYLKINKNNYAEETMSIDMYESFIKNQ